MRVNIIDKGEGIDPDMVDKVFDKYEQAVTKKTGKANSTGIGLTFCKLAIEAHEGTIGVESELKKGSTFYFTLPIEG